MAGILDLFDSPQLLGQLLGGSMGEGSMMPGNVQPPPQPPMNGGIGSDAGQSPGAPQPAGAMAMPPQRPPEAPYPTKPDYVQPPAPPIDPNAMAGAFGHDPANAPMPAGAQPTAPPPPQTAELPMPPPRPAQAALPPNAAPTAGQAPGPPMPPPRPAPGVNLGAPSGAAPAPLPPASEFANPPQGANTGSGLAGALGLNRPALQIGLAGLGKGLSAVGAQPLGASKGQAFAAGAGSALTGGSDQTNKLHDQLSAEAKNVLAAKAEGSTEQYRAAQGQYLAARAKSLEAMTAAGGAGGRGYQNTPEYKVLKVEEDADKWEKGQQILLQKRWTLNGASEEKQEKDLKDLEERKKKFLTERYRNSGIDPNHAEKIKTMGLSQNNPFPKPASRAEFEARVVPGTWYDTGNKYGPDGTYKVNDPKGKELLFTGKPGEPVIVKRAFEDKDWAKPQAAPSGPGASPTANLDDQSAMTNAAA